MSAQIYVLELNEYRDAEKIENDWKNQLSGSPTIHNDLGGTTVLNYQAVIVTDLQSDYKDMSELEYVKSIKETKEINKRDSQEFSTPIELSEDIELVE